MRSVLSRVTCWWIMVRTALASLTPAFSLQSRLERRCSRRTGARSRGGLTRFYESSKWLLRTPRSGDRAKLTRAGVEPPATPTPAGSFRRSYGRGCGGINPGTRGWPTTARDLPHSGSYSGASYQRWRLRTFNQLLARAVTPLIVSAALREELRRKESSMLFNGAEANGSPAPRRSRSSIHPGLVTASRTTGAR
jgi:hypothetical protein